MYRLFTFLVFVWVLACNTASYDADQVKTEVTTMFDNYHEAVLNQGLTGEFDYLDSSDHFFWIPPGYESALNYDSVRTILKANAPLFSEVHFYWDTLQVFPLSENIATYSGVVLGTMTDLQGMETSVRIIESGTVIKRPDGWKLLCGQSANLQIE